MTISQREARRLQKRVDELESVILRQKNRWSSDWSPGWVSIETLVLTPESYAKVTTARVLGHALILVPSSLGTEVRMYAERL